MEVLEDRYTSGGNPIPPKRPMRIGCYGCESLLEFEPDDVKIGAYGCAYIKCPLCGSIEHLNEHETEDGKAIENYNIVLTPSNVIFPNHFHRTNIELGAKEVPEDEINEDIKCGITYLRNNLDVAEWYKDCGALYVNIRRDDGDDAYYVTVTKDFYSTIVDFEQEDYVIYGCVNYTENGGICETYEITPNV